MTVLPSEGPERRLLMQALLEFSDTCEAPALNPNCPFMTDSPRGRQCNEECQDLLAAHGPVRAVEEVDFGEGIVAHRVRERRARRPGPQHAKAFDATEIMATEEQLPVADRSFTTIVKQLDTALVQPPSDDATERTERRDRLHELLDELGRRGVDSDRFLRTVGVDRIAASLTAGLGTFAILADIGDVPTEKEPAVLAEWRRLLVGDGPGPADTRERLELYWKNAPVIAASLANMATNDMLDWVSPAALAVGAPRPLDSQLQWMLDRSTQTYLDGWNPESLRLEWRFLHGREAGFCTSQHAERHVDPVALSKVLADIASDQPLHRARGINTAEHVAKAVEMLLAGRRTAAAAIFESIASVQPDDPAASNNWGFCIIPDNPGQALDLLQQAADLGMDDMAVNLANRVLCLSRIGRTASALSLAERFWTTSSALRNREPSYMWELSLDGSLSLCHPRDTSQYLAQLCGTLARMAGDAKLADIWDERADDRDYVESS